MSYLCSDFWVDGTENDNEYSAENFVSANEEVKKRLHEDWANHIINGLKSKIKQLSGSGAETVILENHLNSSMEVRSQKLSLRDFLRQVPDFMENLVVYFKKLGWRTSVIQSGDKLVIELGIEKECV